jgi:hypothetical protein
MDTVEKFALVPWYQAAPPRQDMTKILILSATFTCSLAHCAFSDPAFDAKTWRSVEKFRPAVLSETLGHHIGKLIAVQFNFRGNDIHHIKPNWYEGSLWQPDAQARKGFVAVRVVVAKNDLQAFEAITRDATSAARLTIYGRVEYDPTNDFYFVRLLGRKAKVDSAGNALLTW